MVVRVQLHTPHTGTQCTQLSRSCLTTGGRGSSSDPQGGPLRTPEAQAGSKDSFPWSTFSAQLATWAESLGQLRRGTKGQGRGQGKKRGGHDARLSMSHWLLLEPGGEARRLAPLPTLSSLSHPAASKPADCSHGFQPRAALGVQPRGETARLGSDPGSPTL